MAVPVQVRPEALYRHTISRTTDLAPQHFTHTSYLAEKNMTEPNRDQISYTLVYALVITSLLAVAASQVITHANACLEQGASPPEQEKRVVHDG